MRAEISKTHPAHEAAPSIASFVIRLQAPPGNAQLVLMSPTGRKGWLGRVEHVQSRRSLTFDNPEAMIRFMEACLSGQASQATP